MGKRSDDFFVCPNCGDDVPEKALACPGCGSDAETGWSEDVIYDGLDIPALDDEPLYYPEDQFETNNWMIWAAWLALLAFLALVFF